MVLAIELSESRKGDVIEIEIESHADGVCRNQKLNVAGLIKGNLRIPRSR